MGIIKAAVQAIGGNLADQWLEVIEADQMGGNTVFTSGVKVHRGQNTKGTDDTVSNGSVIHVYPEQFMMLVDGGKIIDYTAEEGYYTVKNSSLPSLFNGQFGDSLKEAFNRIKYGGQTPTSQKVYFVNLQEIKGIKFGTPNPVNYFDSFYNAELFLRAHGDYSIKIVNPILFYSEVIPKDKARVEYDEISEQYSAEFLEAFQAAINKMSADGQRISFVTSKGTELSKYMDDVLDEEWTKNRGMEVKSVGIASISYDDESQKLINMRNQGAMMQDASIREGYMQSTIAQGIKGAGENPNGAGMGFMGMGMAMGTGGSYMGQASANNMQAMQMQQGQQAAQNMGQQAGGTAAGVAGMAQTSAQGGWTCSCGNTNPSGSKFCSNCGKPKPADANGEWACSCGTKNPAGSRFCSNCGKPRQ